MMGIAGIISGIVVLVVVVGILGWWLFVGRYQRKPEYTIIQGGSYDAKLSKDVTAVLPHSYNQKEGLTFTYSGWILVNDFTYRYGNERTIFSKGDCPGVYLLGTDNSIKVVIDTYGSKESIVIANIPAKKWVHLGIVVNQYSVDVYINGILRQHHTLGQLPKQNTENVKISDSPWDGVLSDLVYYPRSLSAGEMEQIAKTAPTDDLYVKPAGPQYFDMSWYTGRFSAK